MKDSKEMITEDLGAEALIPNDMDQKWDPLNFNFREEY